MSAKNKERDELLDHDADGIREFDNALPRWWLYGFYFTIALAVVFNFELEFPIIEKVGIKGVLFFDTGNAFCDKCNFFQDKQYNLPLGMFESVGFGFRWFSPVGPLRFEWGFPLNRRLDIDQASLFEFTIGNFF